MGSIALKTGFMLQTLNEWVCQHDLDKASQRSREYLLMVCWALKRL
jgi:hypothetical protein